MQTWATHSRGAQAHRYIVDCSDCFEAISTFFVVVTPKEVIVIQQQYVELLLTGKFLSLFRHSVKIQKSPFQREKCGSQMKAGVEIQKSPLRRKKRESKWKFDAAVGNARSPRRMNFSWKKMWRTPQCHQDRCVWSWERARSKSTRAVLRLTRSIVFRAIGPTALRSCPRAE